MRLNHTPAGDATGVKSQLHASGTADNCDTFCPDNGGSSGTGYSRWGFTLQLRGPFDACARAGFSSSTALCAAAFAPTRPLHSYSNYRAKVYHKSKAHIRSTQRVAQTEPPNNPSTQRKVVFVRKTKRDEYKFAVQHKSEPDRAQTGRYSVDKRKNQREEC